MKAFPHIVQFLLVTVLFVSAALPASPQVRDSLVFSLTFESDSSCVDLNYRDNGKSISELDAKWVELDADSTVTICGIRLTGNASRDGWYNKNNKLARKRADSTADFLAGRLGISRDIFSTDIHPWLTDSEKLSAKPVLFTAIPQVEDRSCRITVDYIVTPVQAVPAPVPALPVVTEAVPAAHVAEEVPALAVELPAETEKVRETPVRDAWRLKTNLLYDVATVANLSVEYGFCRHWAVELLATFSPWDINSTFKIRTLLFQPEARYYLKEGYTGHYFGIEGHFGWYNVAFPGNPTRFQDRDGNSPLWGAGLLYGYVLPFSKHWGMDFNIALGYAWLDYDCFYNIENGAKYTSGTRNWFGPTKLGVTIYYQF